MSQSSPPTAADVENALTAAGQAAGTVNLDNIMASVIAEWELRTGWNPFQAGGTNTTRYFDFPNSRTLLLPGYASIATVTTGITYDATTGALVTGTASVLHAGHRFIYWRDGDEDTPIMGIRFACTGVNWHYSYGYRYRSISITGKVGYSLTIPDDVWQAWVDGAAARAYASTNMAETGSISKMSIGGRTIEFNGSEATTWSAAFENSIHGYRRGGIS